MNTRRKSLVVMLLLAGSVAVTGCGGAETGPAAGGTNSAPAPDERVSPTVVATGLKNINGIASQIAAAGSDSAKASALDVQIEPQWKPIEHTVKSNDPASYEAFEAAFGALKSAAEKGDAAAAAKGSQTVSTTTSGYLAKYPG